MHAVRCPHCKKILKLSRPVERVKMKCRNCGGIFLGTTTQVGAPAGPAAPKAPPAEKAPAPAAPAEALMGLTPGGPPPASAAPGARPERPVFRPKRPAQWPIIVVAVGALLIVVFVFIARHYQTHPRVQVREGDKKGPLIYNRRDVRPEHDRRIQELKDQYEKPGGGKPPPPAPKPGPPPGAPDVGPSSSTPRRAPPGARPLGDPRIQQITAVVVDGDAGLGASYLVGEIRSTYDRPLRSVRLSITAYGRDGAAAARGAFQCRYVPAQGDAMFSVPCGGLTSEQFGRAEVVADSAVQMGDLEVCWAVDSAAIRTEQEDARKLVVHGSARNPYGEEIEGVKVYCDFFTEQGIHIGATVGALEQGAGGAIPPGKTRDFAVPFTGSAIMTEPNVYVRIVGRKS